MLHGAAACLAAVAAILLGAAAIPVRAGRWRLAALAALGGGMGALGLAKAAALLPDAVVAAWR
jgi:hypothetical protein